MARKATVKEGDGYAGGSRVRIMRNNPGQGGVDLKGSEARVVNNYHSEEKGKDMTMVTLDTGAAVGIPTADLGRPVGKAAGMFLGLGDAWTRIFGTRKRKKRKER